MEPFTFNSGNDKETTYSFPPNHDDYNKNPVTILSMLTFTKPQVPIKLYDSYKAYTY